MQLAESKARKTRKGPEQSTQDRAALILARYDAGEEIEGIAKHFQITHQAAYKSLLRHCPEEWKSSQAAKALTEYETAKAKLQEIWDQDKAERDQVALACAREQVRTAQWELERVLSKIYAQKQDVTVNIVTDLASRLHHARERLIGSGRTIDSREQPKSLIGKKSKLSEE